MRGRTHNMLTIFLLRQYLRRRPREDLLEGVPIADHLPVPLSRLHLEVTLSDSGCAPKGLLRIPTAVSMAGSRARRELEGSVSRGTLPRSPRPQEGTLNQAPLARPEEAELNGATLGSEHSVLPRRHALEACTRTGIQH